MAEYQIINTCHEQADKDTKDIKDVRAQLRNMGKVSKCFFKFIIKNDASDSGYR